MLTAVNVTSKDWKQQKAVLTATSDAAAASLSIVPQAVSKYALDMISLFPQKTFKGRKNGLRADLAQTLADLHPRFVRFPGGCVAHGDGIDNIYDWKGSIGPLEARKPLRNLWGYHQTRGLGYHEYFLFCEDMGAEPVPVLAAGVPCQNSGTCAHHSKGELTCMGQQGGVPMEEMDQYIQDVLDLIEYANGDARKTVWGKKRAEAGHPKPFNLKFIGIGNEDMITPVFVERFKMIFDAVKAKHPEVTVIGTTGPFYEGTDYEVGWDLATELGVPMVDAMILYAELPYQPLHVYIQLFLSHTFDKKIKLFSFLRLFEIMTTVQAHLWGSIYKECFFFDTILLHYAILMSTNYAIELNLYKNLSKLHNYYN